MAIVNSVVIETPGQGSPILVQRLAFAGVDGVNTVTFPSTGSLAPTCRCGTLRIKVSAGAGTSPAITTVTCTATDGTTTENFADCNPAAAFALTSAHNWERIFKFVLDINATSVSALVTMTGTSETSTIDAELAYSN
jgi:hypothetical protein